MKFKQESAETLALDAMGWLVANDEILSVFLDSSGTSAGDLARGTADLAFLASVLDFVLTDDRWVVAFCDSTGRAYSDPMTARAFLPGGEARNWT